MKIVYCIYGTFNSGGMERVLSIKANYLSDNLGYDVHVVTTGQKGQTPFFQFSPNVKMHDLEVNYAGENENSISKKIIPFFSKLRTHKKRLSKLLFEIKPDITISMFGNEMFFLNEIKDGSKKLIEAHFSKSHRLLMGRKGIFRYCDILRNKLDNIRCKKFDKVIVLTHEDKADWLNFKNVVVISNPCMFESGKRSALQAKQAIAVGRYTYQKGFDLLIDIWNIVYQRYPDWRLKIVGSGVQYNELKNKIDFLGLSKVVELKKTESGNILNEYLTSSIYVLSSRYEGFPMVLLEASSCGLPIVSFKCKCGPKDIIDNDMNGFLVEEGDLNQFAHSIMTLIDNFELRKNMGDNIYTVSKRYSIHNIMNEWDILFKEVIK